MPSPKPGLSITYRPNKMSWPRTVPDTGRRSSVGGRALYLQASSYMVSDPEAGALYRAL